MPEISGFGIEDWLLLLVRYLSGLAAIAAIGMIVGTWHDPDVPGGLRKWRSLILGAFSVLLIGQIVSIESYPKLYVSVLVLFNLATTLLGLATTCLFFHYSSDPENRKELSRAGR